MRIGIIGNGPVGRFFATMLAQGGHQICLLCRNAGEAAALRDSTLRVSGLMQAEGRLSQAVTETRDLMNFRPEYILICTKATDNAAVTSAIAAAIEGAAPVMVSCQNGIDVEEDLIRCFGPGRVLRMILNIGCGVAGPAGVEVKFKFADILSRIPAADGADQRLADALCQAGVEVHLSGDYKKEAFRKAILNTALGTVCAITRYTMRQVMQHPELHRMVREIVNEGSRVAARAGYDLGPDFIAEAMAYLSQGGDHMPSLALDIVKGNISENEWLAGAIYHYAERLGIEVPVMQTVYYFIKSIEGRGADTHMKGVWAGGR